MFERTAPKPFSHYEFFSNAEAQGWRMDWRNWKLLIQVQPDGMFVLDDDSGLNDDEVYEASTARSGFESCTIGPAKGAAKTYNRDGEESVPQGKVAPILVWRYEDAPDSLKYLSSHGGDEDWVAYVPSEQLTQGDDTWIEWLEEGKYGNNVQRDNLTGVYSGQVVIAAHA